MTKMCLISVGLETIALEVDCPKELVSSLGMGMPSAHWNIFMALRELVDHNRTTPSREPDAKKLATKYSKKYSQVPG